MAFTSLLLEERDGIAFLTLSRPERRNAVDMRMREELRQAIGAIARNDDLRVCVVTGAGGSFCAGGDIASMRDRTPGIEDARARMRDVEETVLAFHTLDKPLVAAVDGPAYGAGFGLAMAADMVIATARASFCASFGRVGLAPDFGLHFALPRLVGLMRAKEIVFSAREIGAAEALEIGLVHRIVPEGGLMAAAESLARRFLSASPTALALSKRLLNQSHALDIRQVVEAETAAQAICLESSYHREAARRFLAGEPAILDWAAGEA
jgi:2-(1,2-epoxy-1,2-dihydrophenyl)acetyl-CoA isomerase